MSFAWLAALALPLAWALDACFGEPADRWHPVAWLGLALAPLGRWLCTLRPGPAFAGGAVVWVLLALVLGGAAWGIENTLVSLPAWLAVPLLALVLKPTFAWRMLHTEVAAVERAAAGGLACARAQLARLVSRDVTVLDADMVRETAIETLAENLNDSVVAPLFWYAVAGLPGAVVYRFANTADAMWGYRGAWEWAGKWAARADDALSWLPARITAALLVPMSGREWSFVPWLAAWRALRIEAQRTPSPNGGWPMGAMALRLGVRLRKPGVYALNGAAPSPTSAHTAGALSIASVAAHGAVAAACGVWLVRAVLA